MSKKFLVSIDLNQNELQNVVFQRLGTAPSNPKEGQSYYDNTVKQILTWNGTAWVSGTVGAVTDVGVTSPIQTTGGSTPVISMPAATNSSAGYATAAHIQAIEANSAKVSNATHTGDVTGSTALTIANGAVSLAKMADLATATFIGRVSPSTGVPEALSIPVVKTMLGLGSAAYTNSTVYASSTHADTHKTGGADQIRLDELGIPTGSVNLNTQRIINLGTPTAGTDAVNKDYVDAARSGLSVKDPVKAATTANIDLATGGLLTIDSVNTSIGDRILVKNQTSGLENGIYVVSSSSWTRASDMDASAEVAPGFAVWVNEGSTQGDSRWVLTTNGPITLGTTALVFTKDFQASDIVAGNGLVKDGNTLTVVGTAGRIGVTADAIDIDQNYPGQTSIVTLGTVTTGVWNGSAVPVAHGGTGGTNAATAKSNLGFMSRYTVDNSPASAGTPIIYTHNLGTLDVVVQVFNKSTGAEEEFDVVRTGVNTVTIASATALTASTYRIVIMG